MSPLHWAIDDFRAERLNVYRVSAAGSARARSDELGRDGPGHGLNRDGKTYAQA
jgi:hypothetical protein